MLPENLPETAADRLDSWKDIAGYLRRDVSTVQRWEKREGLPVHRRLHHKLGTVYAFTDEVDAWWQQRGHGLGNVETGRSAGDQQQAGMGPGATLGRERLAWALAATFLVTESGDHLATEAGEQLLAEPSHGQ